jgi:hypothetical protein
MQSPKINRRIQEGLDKKKMEKMRTQLKCQV